MNHSLHSPHKTPHHDFCVREHFGFDTDEKLLAFSEEDFDEDTALKDLVPPVDSQYFFDKNTTQAVLAGFKHTKNVLVQGPYGTGKSTHIEQIAARLGWPCLRINLDGYMTRSDLVGKDMIIIKEGKQVTDFQEGVLLWALQRPVALVLDEYDAARPEILFILQRLLEIDRHFVVMEQHKVIKPHPAFRIFATMNTEGQGDRLGMYQGTYSMNQGQLDRWPIVTQLHYLSREEELQVLLRRVPHLNNEAGQKMAALMVEMANFTRRGQAEGDIGGSMSLRNLLFWGENIAIFPSIEDAFRVTFLYKHDPEDHLTIAEYYQRCFNTHLIK